MTLTGPWTGRFDHYYSMGKKKQQRGGGGGGNSGKRGGGGGGGGGGGRTQTVAASKIPSPFAGLANQGATCYLNSLLQSLYMTPELRSALYKWQYTDEKYEAREECIPYQLQKLFVILQQNAAEKDEGKRKPASTKSLTRSFGWAANESFEQQVKKGPACATARSLLHLSTRRCNTDHPVIRAGRVRNVGAALGRAREEIRGDRAGERES